MSKNMTVLEVLKGARELITSKANWTKGALYRDARGSPCPPEVACSFCSYGAVRKVGGEAEVITELAEKQLKIACIILSGDPYIGAFNDDHKHQDVLNLFDKAICMEEAKVS